MGALSNQISALGELSEENHKKPALVELSEKIKPSKAMV
jgi:hypothetical protein